MVEPHRAGRKNSRAKRNGTLDRIQILVAESSLEDSASTGTFHLRCRMRQIVPNTERVFSEARADRQLAHRENPW